MGAKPLAATQRQVAAILRGAKAAGVTLEIIAEKDRVRFLPAAPAAGSKAKTEVDTGEQGYL
ncbi:hypothetical protein [Aurantimonas coralicida]|uniref:hypothetical protein n=1 Tax=Aurantimonas coralicida TaxID=182270 RepID=UPI0023F55A52|nr:hypothetical protein [Aurantimonas coralicida]